MSTRQINPKAILPGKFAKSSQYSPEELMLIDVGASGGIDVFWAECFGARLLAVGFDPLIAEVDRLNKKSGDGGGIHYEAAYVGCPEYDTLFPPASRQDRVSSKDNTSFPGTRAVRASEAMRMNYVKEIFNAGSEVRFTDRHVSLDGYVQQSAIISIDFVKIDTDGHDIEVILGAKDILRTRGVLGI